MFVILYFVQLVVHGHLRPTGVENELDYYKSIRFSRGVSVCTQIPESDVETESAESESHSDGGDTSTPLSGDGKSEDPEFDQDNEFSWIPPPTSAPTAPSASLANDGVHSTVCCFFYTLIVYYCVNFSWKEGLVICRTR